MIRVYKYNLVSTAGVLILSASVILFTLYVTATNDEGDADRQADKTAERVVASKFYEPARAVRQSDATPPDGKSHVSDHLQITIGPTSTRAVGSWAEPLVNGGDTVHLVDGSNAG